MVNNTDRPPKRDPPIVAEEIGEVDDSDVVDVTDDELTPEEIAALEAGTEGPLVSLTRSIVPSIPGVDVDLDHEVDKLFDQKILAPQRMPVVHPPDELPEEKTQPRASTPSPPAPVADGDSDEDDEDAILAELVARTSKRDP